MCCLQATVAHTRNVLVAFGRALEQWFSVSRINRFTVVRVTFVSLLVTSEALFALLCTLLMFCVVGNL